MSAVDIKKMVIFGAGRIGRSFIGQLFSRAGYKIVFIDKDKSLIEELNRHGGYRIIVKSEPEEEMYVKNISGVWTGEEDLVIEEIASAGLLAISVGLHGFRGVVPMLGTGILKRYTEHEGVPIDIIIAENLRGAPQYLKGLLIGFLPKDFPLSEKVGMVETSIGKMVPVMLKKDLEKDSLLLFAESYNTLTLDGDAFINPLPLVEGLEYKSNMKAWVDRKLFIHNLGHAAAAYIGYFTNPDYIYLHECLADPKVIRTVRETMLEAARILMEKYPQEFTMEDLHGHIDNLLSRFRNIALGDTIHRVGCDLNLKLSANNRLAGVIHDALLFGLPYEKILYAYICGCHFRAGDENGERLSQDKDFEKQYYNNNEQILIDVGGFDPEKNVSLFQSAKKIESGLYD